MTRVLRLLAIAGLLAFGGPASPASAASQVPSIVPTVAPPQLLVRFHTTATDAARAAALSAAGASAALDLGPLGVTRVTLAAGVDPMDAMRALRGDPDVASVEVDVRAGAVFVPEDALWTTDPYTGLGQWGFRAAHVDRAWAASRASADIVVATIDTGVDPTHPDLRGALLPGATFVSAPSSLCPANDVVDDNSHGTHIAGLIAATGNSGLGITGVAFGARLLPIKALDCTGFGQISDVAQSIVWATDHGARIVNISLGTTRDTDVLASAVRYALDRGVLVIAATGNCGAPSSRCATANVPEYPAAYPGVLGVGATDVEDVVTAFSTRGPQVALTAPGVRVVSTAPTYPTYLSDRGLTTSYASLSGTSQASAVVAGVAALVWSAQPWLSAQQVFDRLVATADDLGDAGRDDAYGAGRVNAAAAVLDAWTGALVAHIR